MSGGGEIILGDLRPSLTQRVLMWLRRMAARN